MTLKVERFSVFRRHLPTTDLAAAVAPLIVIYRPCCLPVHILCLQSFNKNAAKLESPNSMLKSESLFRLNISLGLVL